MMKRNLLLSVALLCGFSPSVYAKDCDLAIREGYVAEDLPKILRCFDQRMKEQEAEISDLKRRLEGGARTIDPGAFETDTLSVSVAGASRQKSHIHVSLSIKNKTTERIILAANYNKSIAVLAEDGTGIPMGVPGINGMPNLSVANFDEANWLVVAPNATANMSLTFSSRESKSCLYRLTLHLMRLKNKDIEQISVSLGVKLKDC